MTNEEGKKSGRGMTSGASALAAGLVLLLSLFLMFGGREKTDVPAVSEEKLSAEEPEASKEEASAEEPEISKEELQEENIPESKSPETELQGMKVVEGENDRTTFGIDVSRFQEDIDWKQVAESGVDFVMVRIGCRKSVSGTIMEDDCARYNLREAAANGIHLGAYFFSTAVNEEEAEEEARWVCDFLRGYPITYPVVYNCEGFQEEYSRQHDLTVEERSVLADVFLDKIEEAGYTGMFYASKGELEDNLLWNTDMLEQRYRIWVAQYLPGTYPEISNPEYTGSYVMWQYTDQGTVPGIRTVVDLNVAYFGYDEAASAVISEVAE